MEASLSLVALCAPYSLKPGGENFLIQSVRLWATGKKLLKTSQRRPWIESWIELMCMFSFKHLMIEIVWQVVLKWAFSSNSANTLINDLAKQSTATPWHHLNVLTSTSWFFPSSCRKKSAHADENKLGPKRCQSFFHGRRVCRHIWHCQLTPL